MSTAAERNREALKNSASFLVIADRTYLQALRDDDPHVTELVRLAKMWKKPTFIIANGSKITPEELDEMVKTYFRGHDVRLVRTVFTAEHAEQVTKDIGQMG